MLRIEQKQNIGKEICRYSPRFEHNLVYIKETALFQPSKFIESKISRAHNF